MSACEKSEQWMSAFRSFQEMVDQVLTTDIMSRNAAINACEKGACWEAALGFLWEMLRRSL